jgi:hypothetical protein
MKINLAFLFIIFEKDKWERLRKKRILPFGMQKIKVVELLKDLTTLFTTLLLCMVKG